MSTTILNKNEFLNIPQLGCIYIALTDNLSKWGLGSIISRLIKQHEDGHYNHSILVHRIRNGKPMAMSQDWKLHNVPLENYVDTIHRVKLIQIPVTAEQYQKITTVIDKMLSGIHKYDWLGILGYLLGNPNKIQFKSRWYCSEAVLTALKRADLYRKITTISPIGINKIYHKEGWVLKGIYDPNYLDI